MNGNLITLDSKEHRALILIVTDMSTRPLSGIRLSFKDLNSAQLMRNGCDLIFIRWTFNPHKENYFFPQSRIQVKNIRIKIHFNSNYIVSFKLISLRL